MSFIIPPPEQPSIALVGDSARFPVRRIFCVGQNYADHAREMGNDPQRQPPFFFMKPASALMPDGADIPYPPMTDNLHHEAELAVALDGEGRDIATERALELVWGYAPANDLTRRDLQATAKATGRPWDIAKGFDHAAPIGALTSVAQLGGHPTRGRIALSVNGAIRQEGDLAAMIWPVADIISHLSRFFTLRPGDVILTGTPAGVGPVRPGDVMTVDIEGLGRLTNQII
jgi:fumarylpyruvate hydrolase